MDTDTSDIIDIGILDIMNADIFDCMSLKILNTTHMSIVFLAVILSNKHCSHCNGNCYIDVVLCGLNILTCVVL